MQAHGVGEIDPDVAECAALAHDLGHPPFGHVGEQMLNRLACDAGIEGFEGNAQSFRIITKLACRTNQPGLDLTRATRQAVLKYPWHRDQSVSHKNEKWGAYKSEAVDLEQARALPHGTDPDGQSPEAAIMDVADDLAYALHDFDDFYRAGMIDPRQLFGKAVYDFLVEAGDRVARIHNAPYDPGKWERAIERVQALFADPDIAPLVEPYSGQRHQRACLHILTSRQLTAYVEAVVLEPSAAVQIRLEDDTWHEVNVWKQLTRQYVIRRPDIATIQRGQQRLLQDLFEAMSLWLKEDADRLPTELTETIQAEAADPDVSFNESRPVIDYIAGLTETQAVALHADLTGLGQRSLLGTFIT